MGKFKMFIVVTVVSIIIFFLCGFSMFVGGVLGGMLAGGIGSMIGRIFGAAMFCGLYFVVNDTI